MKVNEGKSGKMMLMWNFKIAVGWDGFYLAILCLFNGRVHQLKVPRLEGRLGALAWDEAWVASVWENLTVLACQHFDMALTLRVTWLLWWVRCAHGSHGHLAWLTWHLSSNTMVESSLMTYSIQVLKSSFNILYLEVKNVTDLFFWKDLCSIFPMAMRKLIALLHAFSYVNAMLQLN